MIDTKDVRGILTLVVTPFKKDLAPDQGRWIRHCRWLRTQNCGLAVFGRLPTPMGARKSSTIFALPCKNSR